MQNIRRQIKQFWSKKTTSAEEQLLLENIQNKEVANDLKLLLRDEFDQAESGMTGPFIDTFTRKQQKKLWKRLKNIDKAVGSEKPFGVTGRFAALLPIAACLLLAAGAYYLFQMAGARTSPMEANITRPSKQIIVIKNGTDKEEKIELPDSSKVILAAGSQISYPDSFTRQSRNIALIGKALFQVTRDAKRPFTVTTSGLITTALGTEFLIDSRKETVLIQLLHGKIAIEATDTTEMKMQTIYLHPGEELRVNPKTFYYWSGKTPSPETKTAAPRKASEEVNNEVGLSFNRTRLDSVFTTLSKFYKTKVAYDSTIRQLSFTGSFESSDSLEVALKIICAINGLHCGKKDGGFVITK